MYVVRSNRQTLFNMLNSLRSLVVGSALMLAATASAQFPYWWSVDGTIAGCYPGQVVTISTIQGTMPQQTITATVDSTTCTFSVLLPISSVWGMIEMSTLCGGAVITAYDSASFNFLLDTAYTNVNWNCAGGNLDCLGIPNGPNVVGSPCDDGDPNTIGDAWSPGCVCVGNIWNGCQAAFSIQQSTPWDITTLNQSTGVPQLTYNWWLPNGSQSTQFEPTFTFSSSGIYSMCLAITDGGGCTSMTCDTIYVDSLGYVSNNIPWYDCLGMLWGPNTPGSACDDNDPNTLGDVWTNMCACVGQGGGQVDCLGIPGGINMPGTACVDSVGGMIVTGTWDLNCNCVTNGMVDCMGILNGPDMPGTLCDDGDSLTVQDTWNANCVCTGVVLNAYDCNGVLNGPDMPGMPCDDGDPLTSNDIWDANCVCAGSNNAPCQAGFWVMQGFTLDSLNGPQPIPNELWIWNLSSGGSGSYTYFWSFGDGTSSTDPFPTHQYANGGPYLLCLTIDDGAGCTSTSCDSVSVDSNGLYTGFSGGNDQRDQGFTINVQNGVQSVGELNVNGGLATWPNPTTDELNIAIADAIAGSARIEMVDANGRVVLSEQTRLAGGRSQLVIGTQELAPGLYMLRISNGERVLNQRIVKGN